VKDVVVLAAVLGAAFVFVFERRRADVPVIVLVGLFLALYVMNVGGGHDVAWLHGVRLTAEPLLLLVVGLLLPQAGRTMRWAFWSIALTACVVAGYGLVQQAVGGWTLVGWGYAFDDEVRMLAGGQLRSFGTLDEPFAYAALLCFAFAVVLFGLRRGVLAWGAGALILVGLGFSFVRTALLILVAFAGLLLRRWGYNASALAVVSATALAGIVILVNAGGWQSHSYAVTGASGGQGQDLNVILNGRVSAWEAALGDNPADWLVGRGVGEVGTAAERARYTVEPAAETDPEEGAGASAVDSGYLAAIADVGLVGFAILLALLARLLFLAWGAARAGKTAGWVALALLVAQMLDALTRASFTGFPTAYLSLLLVGICLAAAAAPEREPRQARP
jgi:O-antigen ligase